MAPKKVDRQSPEYLEEMRFDKLVEAINKKWGHTYIDPPIDVEELFEEIVPRT